MMYTRLQEKKAQAVRDLRAACADPNTTNARFEYLSLRVTTLEHLVRIYVDNLMP